MLPPCRRWYRCHVNLSSFLPPPAVDSAPAAAAAAGDSCNVTGCIDSIPYLPNASSLSPEEFGQRFDTPGQPVLLGGLAGSWEGAVWDGWKGCAGPGWGCSMACLWQTDQQGWEGQCLLCLLRL